MSSIVDHIEWGTTLERTHATVTGWACVGFWNSSTYCDESTAAQIPIAELSTERVMFECNRITNNICAAFASSRNQMIAFLEIGDGSFNGRTPGFDPGNAGSNPAPSTIEKEEC